MALPTITKMQKTAQEMLNKYQQQQASSTASTQSGSTSTPTITETPKVTSTPNAQQSQKEWILTKAANKVSEWAATQERLQPWWNPVEKIFWPADFSEETKEKAANLFDVWRNIVKPVVDTWKAFKQWQELLKENAAEYTKDFDKRYTPEWLKQYFNYYAWPTLDNLIWNTAYTTIDAIKWITNWVNSSVSSISERLPDEWLLVRKWILPSVWEEQIQADKQRKAENRERIAASVLDTAAQMEKWMDNTELWKDVKSVEWKSLVEALEQWDIETAQRVLWNYIWYMAPSIAGWILWWEVWVVATTFPVMYQDTLEDYMSDESISKNATPEQIHWYATVSSILQTAIEVISLDTQLLRPLNRMKSWVSSKVTQNVLSRALWQWLKWSIAEAWEEITQQWIEDKFAQLLGSNREMLTFEDYANIWLEAFLVWLIVSWPWTVVEWVSTKRQKILYNENIRKIREAVPDATEDEAKEILDTIIAYEEKQESLKSMEDKSEKLYENKQEIINQLNELNQDPINNQPQIQLLENRLETIENSINKLDQKINEIYWPMEEINKRLDKQPTQQDIESTVKTTYENMRQSELDRMKAWLIPWQQSNQRQWWENLSEQTMWEVDTKTKAYEEYEKIKKNVNNKKITNKNWNVDTKKRDKLVNDIKWKSLLEWAKKLAEYNLDSLAWIMWYVSDIEEWKISWPITKTEAWKIKNMISQAARIIKAAREKIGSLTDEMWYDERNRALWIKWNDTALQSYITRDQSFSKHLPWLKWISIKNLAWDMTEEDAHKFGMMLAHASQILWIDFNKVLEWLWFSIAVWPESKAYAWFFNKTFTKEQLQELAERIENSVSESAIDTATSDFFKAWIYLATEDDIDINEATATMIHEFMHLMDYKMFKDEWLPIWRHRNYKWYWVNDWTSVIEWDEKWKTFNKQNITSKKDKEYYNSWKEILARYTEQYILYEIDKELFDKYATKHKWYWSETEFLKLKDDFESILETVFWKFALEEWNEMYYDVMKKLDDYKNTGKLTNDKVWMQNIKESMANAADDVHASMLNMQKEYVILSEQLDNMKWDIWEEVRAEYATTLDWLKQNMDMLEQLWREYTDFVSKKLNLAQSDNADEATQSTENEMWKDKEEIKEEDWQFDSDEELQQETDVEEMEEEPEKEKLNTFKEDYNAFLEEQKRQKKWEYKINSMESKKDVWTVAKNILTPTMTRIYNINKRVAWRLTQMETQTWINIYRYTQKTQWFAETFNNLNKEQQLEVSQALFNFWALAKEQTEEDLAWYKEEEVKKLKDVLHKNWFKDEDINSLFEVLNDLWTRYKDAWMKISVSDLYFPRTVKDYKWLIAYLNEHSENTITEKSSVTLYWEIQKIVNDTTLSEEEKEEQIRRQLTKSFTPKKPEKTKYSKERQLWLLSDWWAGIYAYYENPVESLASYITAMEQAIQRQLFLWWMKTTLWIETNTMEQTNEESVSEIIKWMFEKWQITEEQMSELHTCLMAVLNKKWTPRWVRAIKNITYTMALTNYISAMNQAEDIWVAIVENKRWLISVLKSIFTKAWIKYDEAWLESAYEMFKAGSKPSDWLFRKSWFNAIDRIWKRSFINAAWTSMVKTYKNPKARWHLYERLKAMYWDEVANHIMECVRTNNYMTDWQIDIHVLTDLLYQLWNTQPIFQSSMPVSYLEHPQVRWLYSLSMFSLRQIDHIIQSTKSAYEEWWVVNAAYVWFKLITARMFFNALIWWVTSLLQWDVDDSWIWKLFEWDWEWAGKTFWSDMLKWFLKMWMFSKYDWKTWKDEWLWAFIMNRLYPYILQEWYRGRKSVEKALKNDDRTELMTMIKDVPLLWKQAYWRWKFYQDNYTWDPFEKAFDNAFDSAFDNAFDSSFDSAFDTAFNDAFNDSFSKAFK